MANPYLSIIIPCYNYEQYIAYSINSVLEQLEENIELIVVDDCSTDNSRSVIKEFGDKIIFLPNEVNSGHASAFNKGFDIAKGELIMFLDADDFLLPNAIKTIKKNYDPKIAIYNYRMYLSNKDNEIKELYPPKEQDFYCDDASEKLRFLGRYPGTVTSGLVFSKSHLKNVMPIPQEEFRQGGDGYLCAVVPLYGECSYFEDVISAYRQHQANHSKFEQRLSQRARWNLEHNVVRYKAIKDHSNRLGLPYDENLGDSDLLNLEQCMAAILFRKPDEPEINLTKRHLANKAIELIKNRLAPIGIFNFIWWNLLVILPTHYAAKILRWKLDAKSRPEFVSKLALFLRKKAKIVVK